MQTGKRRISIFPFFNTDGDIVRTPRAKSADEVVATPLAAPHETRVAPVITARGQRFAVDQIGSIFGSD